jgi:hypothetical protein
VSTADPGRGKDELSEEAAAQTSQDPSEKTTGDLAQALAAAGSLGHAGPYVYFRFTVVDDGGATATRAVLHDLVNVHLTVDHGYGWPVPPEAMVLEGKVTTPPTQVMIRRQKDERERFRLNTDEVDYEALFQED